MVKKLLIVLCLYTYVFIIQSTLTRQIAKDVKPHNIHKHNEMDYLRRLISIQQANKHTSSATHHGYITKIESGQLDMCIWMEINQDKGKLLDQGWLLVITYG